MKTKDELLDKAEEALKVLDELELDIIISNEMYGTEAMDLSYQMTVDGLYEAWDAIRAILINNNRLA